MSFWGGYATLNDTETLGTVYAGKSIQATVLCKFCTKGVVTSKKWTEVFLRIQDGLLRLYDSEDRYRDHEGNFAFELPLGKEMITTQRLAKVQSNLPFIPRTLYLCFLNLSSDTPFHSYSFNGFSRIIPRKIPQRRYTSITFIF